MSFLDQQLHLAHGHPDELCLSAPGGPVCCLACLFSSLQEPSVLRTRKVYVLRHFADLCAGADALVAELCSRHAMFVVPALVDCALLCQEDPPVLAALCDVVQVIGSGGGPLVAAMLVESLLQASSTSAESGQSSGAVQGARGGAPLQPAVLQVLHILLAVHPDARSVAACTLTANPGLCASVTHALDPATSDVDLPTRTLLLQLLTAVVGDGSEGGQALAAELGVALFVHTARLLAATAARGPHAGPGPGHSALGAGWDQQQGLDAGALAELRAWCLRLLTTLATSMLSSPAGWGAGLGAGPEAAAAQAADVLAGVKPCLLSPSYEVQGLAAQLVSGLCRAAHPLLLRQLLEGDLVEYMCELITSTLGGAGGAGTHKRKAPGGVTTDTGSGPAATAHAEMVQVHAVVALRHLAYEGSFGVHITFGVDALLGLAEVCLAAANTPLLADVMALLATCMARQGRDGEVQLTSTDLTRVVQVAGGAFPAPLTQAALPSPVSTEQGAVYASACSLLEAAAGQWGQGGLAATASKKLETLLAAAVQRAVAGVGSVALGAAHLEYLRAACGVLNTWAALLAGHQAVGKGDRGDAGLAAVVGMAEEHVLPCVLGLWSSTGAGEAVHAALQCLCTALQLSYLDTAGPVTTIATSKLASSLVSKRFISKSFELMATLAPEMPTLPLLCWRILLLLAATPRGSQPPMAVGETPAQVQSHTPGQEQQSNPQGALHLVEEAAAVYVPHTSVEAVLRCLVTQGPLALAPHSSSMLLLLHMAYAGGDDACADPTWLLHALVEVMNSCCPHSHSASHHVAVCEAALSLYIDLHERLVADGFAQLPPAAQPQQLVPALQQYSQVVPEAVELGSVLGEWVLRHCDQLHGIAADAMATWLRVAMDASREMLCQVMDHLAAHANPGVLHALVQLLQHAQSSGDSQLAAGVLTLLSHVCKISTGEACALLVHHGFLALSQRQLLACQADALAGDPHALAELLSTLAILQALAGAAASKLASLGWPSEAQAAETWQVLGRVASQVAALVAKCLAPPGALESLVGHAAGCALLVMLLDVAGIVASMEVASSCAHGGHTGCDLPGARTRWPRLQEALTHILDSGLVLVSASGNPDALVPLSHAAQLCSMPVEVVAAAVQLSAVLAIAELHGISGSLDTSANPVQHQQWSSRRAPHAFLPPSEPPPSEPEVAQQVETLAALALVLPAPSTQAAAIYAAWAQGLAALKQQDRGVQAPLGRQGAEQAQPPWLSVVVMMVESSAAQEDVLCRSAGTLGLCALHLWQQGTVGGHIADTPWAHELLNACVQRLGAAAVSGNIMGNDGVGGSGARALVLLPDLLLLHLFLKHMDSKPDEFRQGGEEGARSTGSPARDPMQWVRQVVGTAAAAALLPLLLTPPGSIACMVNSLTAELVAAGLLDAHLSRLRDACQAGMWAGVAAGQTAEQGLAVPAGGGNLLTMVCKAARDQLLQPTGTAASHTSLQAHASDLSFVPLLVCTLHMGRHPQPVLAGMELPSGWSTTTSSELYRIITRRQEQVAPTL